MTGRADREHVGPLAQVVPVAARQSECGSSAAQRGHPVVVIADVERVRQPRQVDTVKWSVTIPGSGHG